MTRFGFQIGQFFRLKIVYEISLCLTGLEFVDELLRGEMVFGNRICVKLTGGDEGSGRGS